MLQQFLTENKLNLILRSHEGPDARFKRDDMPPVDQGYALDHQCKSETIPLVFLPVDAPGSKLHAHCLCLLCLAHPFTNADDWLNAGDTAFSTLAVSLLICVRYFGGCQAGRRPSAMRSLPSGVLLTSALGQC